VRDSVLQEACAAGLQESWLRGIMLQQDAHLQQSCNTISKTIFLPLQQSLATLSSDRQIFSPKNSWNDTRDTFTHPLV
jgi:hypothetical protein